MTYKVTDDDFTALVEDGSSILLSNLSGSSSNSSSSSSSRSRSTCRSNSSFVYSESTASSSLADPSVARF